MNDNNKVRWGIIGLGRIAEIFARDLQLVKSAELVAVASTDMSRAKQFAIQFDCSTYYGSYDKLFRDENVDVVYIATLHPSHCQLSIEAMNHGKHVLCEKPVAMNANEAMAMVEKAKTNQVFFMEAFWTRFNPSIVNLKKLIDNKEIGALRYINAEFSFYKLDDHPTDRSLNVALGGGSLLDMGVYPIFLSYFLLGMPNDILAKSQFFTTGAEIQTSMLFQYTNAQALLYSGFANNTDMKAKISGEKGEIFIEPIWHETQGFHLVKNGVVKKYNLPTFGKGFTYEIDEVNYCIINKKRESKNWSHQNSIDLISIVDNVRKQAGINYPFDTQYEQNYP